MRKGQTKRVWTPEQEPEIVHKYLDDHVSVRTLEREYTAGRITIDIENQQDAKIDEITFQISECIRGLKPPILTIPGIGELTAAVILSEYGDINKFKSPAQMLVLAVASTKLPYKIYCKLKEKTFFEFMQYGVCII